MAGPARVRGRCAHSLRAASSCLVLIALSGAAAHAQTVTPDLFSPTRSSQLTSADSPLRRTNADPSDRTGALSGDPRSRVQDTPAPSRIGQPQRYGNAAASGAADWGYDSLNRKRKQPKYYPGQVKPKPPVGPGNPPLPVASGAPQRLSIPPSQTANKTPIPPAMAGTVMGQPPRKRLRMDDDPFGAVGEIGRAHV